MRVLQIGHDDWSTSCRVPADLEWTFVDAADGRGFDPALVGRTDAAILAAPWRQSDLDAIDALIAPHTLIVAQHLAAPSDEASRRFLVRKAAVPDDLDDRQGVIDRLSRAFFPRQFGQKLELRTAWVSPRLATSASYEGNAFLATEIDHDGSPCQLVLWRENILYENSRALELWPEYVKDAGCEVELVVQLIQSGTPDVIASQRTYSEAELSEPVVFSHPTSGYLSCSIFARGRGQVRVGPLHYRHSRLGAGQFLPGGKRIVDARREELFHFFHPGDLTPPLNVYFAGYRPAEGFEGYYMMSGLRHPFLLVTDPRLEGGRFYLGSDELETRLRDVIRAHIDRLGFREEDVIFSGLSMGSFGALYYGSQYAAHAIIAGKPIVDLGHVAERARLVRPKDFLTILDVVNFWAKADADGEPMTVDAFTRGLIRRWSDEPGFGDTKILMSYMAQDDYDDEAYYTLLNSQTGKPTTVIARGYQGRHNDDSASIVTWFVNQYKRVIDEYAGSR